MMNTLYRKETDGPYIFVSYAHKDSSFVLPVIKSLKEKGFRIWYDDGIEAGTEWPEYIAEMLNGSSAVLCFMSRAAQESQNCRREINFAIHLNKEMLVVYCENTELSNGMKMQLGILQSIFRDRFASHEAFVNALADSRLLRSCKSANPAPINKQLDRTRIAIVKPKPSKEKEIINDPDATKLHDLAKKRCDGKEKVELETKAAELGHAEAQNSLGFFYFYGRGVDRDYAKAEYWWTKSAEQGHAEAQYKLGCFYLGEKGTAQDLEKAVYWLKKSSDKRYYQSLELLADCYAEGKGVAKDYEAAIYWYTESIKHTVMKKTAIEKRDKLKKEMESQS